jgi:acyl-CoA synthetase (AMP-forming)/AMP-acid ligase II
MLGSWKLIAGLGVALLLVAGWGLYERRGTQLEAARAERLAADVARLSGALKAAEKEAAIQRSIAEAADRAVAEAAVVGVPDDTGDEAIRAFVVLKEGRTDAPLTLLAHCRARLAPYKTPNGIEIRAELPKNAMGKVLKKELRNEAQSKRRRP